MTDSIWPTIHAERRALADDLDGLTAKQWSTPSLCSEWDVHQVLAHMLSIAKMTPPKFLARMASARFSFHDFSANQVAHGSPTRSRLNALDYHGHPRC